MVKEGLSALFVTAEKTKLRTWGSVSEAAWSRRPHFWDKKVKERSSHLRRWHFSGRLVCLGSHDVQISPRDHDNPFPRRNRTFWDASSISCPIIWTAQMARAPPVFGQWEHRSKLIHVSGSATNFGFVQISGWSVFLGSQNVSIPPKDREDSYSSLGEIKKSWNPWPSDRPPMWTTTLLSPSLANVFLETSCFLRIGPCPPPFLVQVPRDRQAVALPLYLK